MKENDQLQCAPPVFERSVVTRLILSLFTLVLLVPGCAHLSNLRGIFPDSESQKGRATGCPSNHSVLPTHERVGIPLQSSANPLAIVTYNVHLLPDIAAGVAGNRSNTGYRAQAIAEQLFLYDIVGICEAFDRGYTQSLLDTIQSRTSNGFAIAKGPQRSGRHLIGGGLLLLSRYPIEESHTVTFKNASRFVTSGFKADGFAAKGALHARIRIGDDRDAVVDCFLTHLESQSIKARDRQIVELTEFIAVHSNAKIPSVVFGDFNVTSDDSNTEQKANHDTPYQRLRRALAQSEMQLVDVWDDGRFGHGGTSDALAGNGGRRIDYIFLSNPHDPTHSRLTSITATTLPMLDQNVPEASLSDHLALACQAEFHGSKADD